MPCVYGCAYPELAQIFQIRTSRTQFSAALYVKPIIQDTKTISPAGPRPSGLLHLKQSEEQRGGCRLWITEAFLCTVPVRTAPCLFQLSPVPANE